MKQVQKNTIGELERLGNKWL